VANGRRRRRFFSTFSHFPPKQLHLDLHFLSFDIKVLLYHGPRPLFTHAFPFPWPINYDRISWCHNPHLHCRFDFVEDLFVFPWNYGIVHCHILRAPSRISKWRTIFRVIFRFDPNATSLWQRTQTSKGVCSSWSWTPSNLVLSYFTELSHLGDLVTSRPCFRWWTRNCLWRLLRNQRHFYLRLVFSFRRWTLLLVMQLDSSIAS